jgi:CheY-like chemotaxis protein
MTSAIEKHAPSERLLTKTCQNTQNLHRDFRRRLRERNRRVLVVEDAPLIREFVVELLREGGYDVLHAADGEQALAWCGRRAADVLVTDIMLLGKVDGLQIAELCREHDPDLPVIYATGFSPVSPRPVPGSLMVQKHYHPDQVVRAIKELAG